VIDGLIEYRFRAQLSDGRVVIVMFAADSVDGALDGFASLMRGVDVDCRDEFARIPSDDEAERQ
jgi:hypothetical protein